MTYPPNYTGLHAVPNRFGREVEVHLHPLFPDGKVMFVGGRYLWIGSRPLEQREQWIQDIRLQVRRGLADVLTWLGEPVNIFPTSQDILDAIRAGVPASVFGRNREWC